MVTGRNPLPLPGINSLWGGQASLHRCEVTGYDAVLKLPEGCDPWDYIPLEVAAISWRGTSITFPAPGETAVVVGQGLIGAFAAKWLLYHGARVIVVDLCESRLNKARKWGVAAALGGNAPDIRDRILSYCPGGADIVVEASASTRGAELAGSLLRQPASRAQNREYSVPALHSDAHFWPRVSFLASYPQSFQTGPNGLVTVEGAIVCKSGDRSLGDRLAVMERIRQGDLLVADIIEGATPVDQAPQAYAELRDHSDRKAALAFKW